MAYFNIFNNKPAEVAALPTEVEMTPSQSTVSSAAAPKKSFIQSFFTLPEVQTYGLHHQVKLIPMLSKHAVGLKEFTQIQTSIHLKNAPTKELLDKYYELNNLSEDESIQSDTFQELFGLLDEKRVQEVYRQGKTRGASEIGGKAHAKEVIAKTLLPSMQEGVRRALQGRHIHNSDYADFVEYRAQRLSEKALEGSATPQEVVNEIEKMSRDPILGPHAEEAQADPNSTLTAVKQEAETQIAETEIATVIEGIQGNYKRPQEIRTKISTLMSQLDELKTRDDTSVEDCKRITDEMQSITSELISCIKQVNPQSTFSAEQMRSPLSRNTNSGKGAELNSKFDYELDKVCLILDSEIDTMNKELVETLRQMQGNRSIGQRIWDKAVGTNITKIIDQSDRTQKSIKTLTKRVDAYEKLEAAKIAKEQAAIEAEQVDTSAKPSRTWSEYLFSRPKSDEAVLEEAIQRLDEFTSREDVREVFSEAAKLQAAEEKIQGTKYWSFGKKEKDLAKASLAIAIHAEANKSIFEELETLTSERDAAQATVDSKRVVEAPVQEEILVEDTSSNEDDLTM